MYAKNPVLPCSPSVTTSTPCASCWSTAAPTAWATAPSRSGPRSPSRILSSSGAGRGRLPTCVVRMRSVLRFTGRTLPGSREARYPRGCGRHRALRAGRAASGLGLHAAAGRVALLPGLGVLFALLGSDAGLDLVAEVLVDVAPVLKRAGQDRLGHAVEQVAGDVGDQPLAGGGGGEVADP